MISTFDLDLRKCKVKINHFAKFIMRVSILLEVSAWTHSKHNRAFYLNSEIVGNNRKQ